MSATWPARASSCRSKLNAAFSFINPCSVLTQLINLLPAAHFFLGLEFDIYWRKMPVVSWDFCYFTSVLYLILRQIFCHSFFNDNVLHTCVATITCIPWKGHSQAQNGQRRKKNNQNALISICNIIFYLPIFACVCMLRAI